MPSATSPMLLRRSSSVMSPAPNRRMPDLSSPRSTNCRIMAAAWPAGMKTKTPSGAASRTRCRNGAKSGLSMGTRNARGTSPPARVNVSLKYVSESWPGAKSETTAMFGRPIGHDHDRRSLGKARAHDIGRALGHDRGGRRHHHHGRLGLGCKRSNGERDRGEPETGENIHLVADQKLLGNAPAVVGNAGVVAQDELDFPAINRRAILLHIESGARFDLLARRRKRPRDGKNETDLDGLFGRCVRRGQRKNCQSGQCPPHSFVLQFIRYQRRSWRFPRQRSCLHDPEIGGSRTLENFRRIETAPSISAHHSTSATTRAGLASPPLIFKGSAISTNLFVPICERLVTN